MLLILLLTGECVTQLTRALQCIASHVSGDNVYLTRRQVYKITCCCDACTTLANGLEAWRVPAQSFVGTGGPVLAIPAIHPSTMKCFSNVRSIQWQMSESSLSSVRVSALTSSHACNGALLDAEAGQELSIKLSP